MKIVYVDDDPDLRDIVEFALASLDGMDVRAEGKAREALDYAIVSKPNLVVTDVNMPDMDGASLLAALKSNAQTRHIPVVFLTGASDPELHERLLALGARAILAKPFDLRSLGSKIVELASQDQR